MIIQSKIKINALLCVFVNVLKLLHLFIDCIIHTAASNRPVALCALSSCILIDVSWDDLVHIAGGRDAI